MPLTQDQATLRAYIVDSYDLPGKRTNLTADMRVLDAHLDNPAVTLKDKQILLAEAIAVGLRIKKAIEDNDLTNAETVALLARLENKKLSSLTRALGVAIGTLFGGDPADVFTNITLDNIFTATPQNLNDDQATYDAIGSAINEILTAQNLMLKPAPATAIHGASIATLGVGITFNARHGGGGGDPVGHFNYTRPIKIGNKYRNIERILTTPQGTEGVDNVTVMQAISDQLAEVTQATKKARYTDHTRKQNEYEKDALFNYPSTVATTLDGDKYRCRYADERTGTAKNAWYASTTNQSLSYHVQDTGGFNFFNALTAEELRSNQVRAANTLWDAIDAGTKGLTNTTIDDRFPTIYFTENAAGGRELQAGRASDEDMKRLASIALGVLISGFVPQFQGATKITVSNYIKNHDRDNPEAVKIAYALKTILDCRATAGDGQDVSKMDQVFNMVTNYIEACSSWFPEDLRQLVQRRDEGMRDVQSRRASPT